MDYKRIYDQLIADRRANPPPTGEYAEVHHILPRCMGGGNEPSNLVRLRPEDHFFSHLLLAKVYGGRLWAAVQIMAGSGLSGSRGRSPAKDARARLRYGRLVRLSRSKQVGANHPSSDVSVYQWESLDGEAFTGTRHEMKDKLGSAGRGIDNALTGFATTVGGWFCPDVLDEPTLVRLRAGRLGGRDKSLHTVRTIDDREEFTGERWQIVTHTGISRQMVDRLILGQCHSADGWYCPAHNEHGVVGSYYTSGDRAGTANKTIYEFQHFNGEMFTGTRMGLVERYGLNRQAVHNMAVGASASSSGWYMVSDGRPVDAVNDNAHAQQFMDFAA